MPINNDRKNEKKSHSHLGLTDKGFNMNSSIHYRGYVGNVEFSEEDMVFHGKVVGVKDLISFEGDSVSDLTEDFHNAVNEYLDFCEQNGKKP